MIKRYGSGVLIKIPDFYDQDSILVMTLFDEVTGIGRLTTDGFHFDVRLFSKRG